MSTIRLKMLTPIWTGDIDRDSGILKETGIIGSLRWWYEGIIRGMGGYVSSPSLNETNNECAVGRLFGSTGSARRFILRGKASSVPLMFISNHQVYAGTGNWLYRVFGGRDTGGQKKGRGADISFEFGVKMLWSDEVELSLIPRFDRGIETEHLVAFILDSICRFGAIGSKRQNGFGVVRVLSGFPINDAAAGRELARRIAIQSQRKSADELRKYEDLRRSPRPASSSPLFDMRDAFFRTYIIRDPEPYRAVGREIGRKDSILNRVIPDRLIPCAFDIRYKNSARNPLTRQGRDFGLRPYLNAKLSKDATNGILGESREGRDHSASRIFVSHLYRESTSEPYQLRIWGYIPPSVGRFIDPDNRNSVRIVSEFIDAFISDNKGMFPGSQVNKSDPFKEIL